jgi:hypothetical protein
MNRSIQQLHEDEDFYFLQYPKFHKLKELFLYTFLYIYIMGYSNNTN